MDTAILSEYSEIAELIEEKGGTTFSRCFQCGLCDTVCPWNRVRNFSMRKVIRQGLLGLTEVETEDIWRCTTCGKCVLYCPRDVRQIDAVTSLRRLATEFEIYPNSVKPIHRISSNLANEGNPLDDVRSKRAEWAKDLDVPRFEEEMSVLYFPGCYLCYDPRMKKVARSTVNILSKAGVDFGILAEQENCCGESIRKAGHEEVFKKLARENIKAFVDNGVRQIVVSSPHCYHTFKNEYPDLGGVFEIKHMTQFLLELVEQGRLELNGDYGKRVTYHDPCYLGRHNSIYEQPRDLLSKISGVELVEMAEYGINSLCCGGGGGRIWMDTPRGERFSDIRVKQAADAEADVLVTACPYCITNFEESRLNLDLEDSLEIKDITEIIEQVI